MQVCVKWVLLLLLCRPVTGYSQKEIDSSMVVEVHEGVSLVGAIQYLAGQLSNSTPSTYKADLKKYFFAYRNHPAVNQLFLEDVVYPDLTELGFSFYNFPDIKVHPLPESMNWYKYIPKEELELFLQRCIDFYKQSNFHRFYLSYREEYKRWGADFSKQMERPVRIFNEAFSSQQKYSWYICLEPLNDWGAHTYTKKNNPAFNDKIVYQQGYFGNKDSAGKMVFRANFYDIAWHEGAHAITDKLLRQYRDSIVALADLMKEDETLKRQNIHDWPHYFNELIARSVSLALFKKHLKPASYEQLLKLETGRGFIHVQDVAEVLLQTVFNDQQPLSLDDSLLRVLAMLREKYSKATH